MVLDRLQKVLVDCYNIEKDIQEIPVKIENKKEQLNKCKAQYLDLMERVKNIKSSINENKTLFNDKKAKREAAELKLEKVTTQREYDLENAIVDDCKSEEKRLKFAIQKLEKNKDILTERIKDTELKLKDLNEKTDKEIEALDADLIEKKKQNDSLQKKREKYSKDLNDPELLFKIERIIKNKGTIASAPLRSGVCMGCYMQLPDQFVNVIRSNTEVQFCPYCSRILYYEKGKDDEEILESNAKYIRERQNEITKEESDIEYSDIQEDSSVDMDISGDDDVEEIIRSGKDNREDMIADESEFDF